MTIKKTSKIWICSWENGELMGVIESIAMFDCRGLQISVSKSFKFSHGFKISRSITGMPLMA